MSEHTIRLIVGLGNVGAPYTGTRHNAGFYFVDEVIRKFGGFLNADKKFSGSIAKTSIGGREVLLLEPSTLMNLSGHSVAAVCNFYKIFPREVLVAHDELDLPPGSVKLKVGGGTAGHNGLKSIQACLGNADFVRLRIGIGHPREKGLSVPVADYVLSRPSREDRNLIEEACAFALSFIPEIVQGDITQAMRAVNERKA